MLNYFFANKFFFLTLGVITALVLGHLFFISPPSDFKSGTVLEIQPGMTLRDISLALKNENIIRSRLAFEALVILQGGERHIKYSGYLFEDKMPVYLVARWIVKGERYMAPVVATIPEGFNKEEIADVYALKLINFNKENFLAQAKEGYLFPDTYFFFRADDEMKVIESMNKNFEKKIASIRPEILATGKTEGEIIIMASILEKEASGDTDRGLVSGILWKRISLNMPLQVDAEPKTYKTKGLPPSPIGNPGLEAIHAAIYPQNSPYLYYLHDKEGNTHFAETFSQHKKNIAKYLK